MPRGIAVPEARQQLFAALELVLADAGPLTSRAVTGAAGVSTGLLFAHFTNFDEFLAGYAVDRSFQLASAAAGLADRAGTGTVAGNLGAAALATPLDRLSALVRLLAQRPGLTGAVTAVLGSDSAGLRPLERAVAGYLAAEQRHGRVAAGADPEALALAVAGVVHHVALSGDSGPAAEDRIRRAVAALTGSSPVVTA